MKDRPHDEAMAEAYRKRPGEAFAMFRALLLDGGQLGEWRISGVTSGLRCVGGKSLDLHHGPASAGFSFW